MCNFSEFTFSLKFLINKDKTKVLFAEADKDFAELLLSFLRLPLGTIIRLLKKHYGDEAAPAFGSLANLSNSVDHYHLGTEVPNVETKMDDGFTVFLICDDLKVIMGGSFMETMMKLGNVDTDGAEQRTVTVGFNETMDLLKGSLSSNTVLTDLILGPRKIDDSKSMHKADMKYEIGKVTDEEEAKQRQWRAILNKLTPRNFQKLFRQAKVINIDNAITLSGLVAQIFDKALMEPTFCEMYANFAFCLAPDMPELSADYKKVSFKRLLVNRCQEEFERGGREEEGEVKQTEEKRRRRKLGNIRFIGELFKKRMLTERIMHACINKLLGHPDEENIEGLCILMSTIGEMIDHPMAKELMDAYFDIMRRLSNDATLSSRVRFMLKDAIDLRKNSRGRMFDGAQDI